MAQKMICDYCLQEVTANFTRMSVQTLRADGMTAEADPDEFEFHPRCYNALQGLITQMRLHQQPPPLDPTSPDPAQQPVNDNDPEPVIPIDITPAPPRPPEPEPAPVVVPDPQPVTPVTPPGPDNP